MPDCSSGFHRQIRLASQGGEKVPRIMERRLAPSGDVPCHSTDADLAGIGNGLSQSRLVSGKINPGSFLNLAMYISLAPNLD